MGGSDMHKEILEALKYRSADDFKSTQRKLSTARNTIIREAFCYPYSAFFTEEERHTLKEATEILGRFKQAVEHAKEIRAREALTKKQKAERRDKAKEKILNKFMEKSDIPVHQREAIVMYLALGRYSMEISESFFDAPDVLRKQIDRVLDTRDHLTAIGLSDWCFREVYSWLKHHLWPKNVEPSDREFEEFYSLYSNIWRPKIVEDNSITKRMVDDFSAALMSEVEANEKKARQKTAIEKRSQFSVVKK